MAGLVNIKAINTIDLEAKLRSGADPSFNGIANYGEFSDASAKLTLSICHEGQELADELYVYVNGENFCVLKTGDTETFVTVENDEITDKLDVSDIIEVRTGDDVLLIGVFNEV